MWITASLMHINTETMGCSGCGCVKSKPASSSLLLDWNDPNDHLVVGSRWFHHSECGKDLVRLTSVKTRWPSTIQVLRMGQLEFYNLVCIQILQFLPKVQFVVVVVVVQIITMRNVSISCEPSGRLLDLTSTSTKGFNSAHTKISMTFGDWTSSWALRVSQDINTV